MNLTRSNNKWPPVIFVLWCLSIGLWVNTASANCDNTKDCIGITIDAGDPVLIKMVEEMSALMAQSDLDLKIKSTEGPITNVAKVLSERNVGLTIVPSDMLLYTARSDIQDLKQAEERLRFVMSIGRKVVHVIARKDLTSIQQLNDKRVVMGLDTTPTWVVASNLLHMHEAQPAEKIQLQPIFGLLELIKGNADAVFVLGDTPLTVISNISELLKHDDLKAYAKDVHLMSIEVDQKYSEYRPVVVDYPGFAENISTVAILPTLVSYDFTHRSTPYFKNSCAEMEKLGSTIRNSLGVLRESGHNRWAASFLDLEAGSWKKDGCFFGQNKKS